MIAKAIRERRPGARPVHFATDRRLGTVPGLDMLIVKAGGVSAHPANLHRLLFDEGQLVLAFPRSRPPGALHARYRLRPFERLEPLRAALRAGVPIIPVAVLGSEEATPVLGRLGLGRRLPLGAALAAAGQAASALPGAARRPRPRQNYDRATAPRRRRVGRSRCVAGADLRALIQENLLEMLSRRRSVWLG